MNEIKPREIEPNQWRTLPEVFGGLLNFDPARYKEPRPYGRFVSNLMAQFYGYHASEPDALKMK